MKKVFLMLALLLVCFWHISVKADDAITETIENENKVVEVIEEKKEEISNEELTNEVVKEEVVKEEAKPIVKAFSGAKGFDDDFDQEVEDKIHTTEHHNCIYLIREYDNKELTYICSGESGSATKTYPKGQHYNLNDHSENGITYTFKGWYDESGELLTTEKGVKVTAPKAVDKCTITYVYAKFDQIKEPAFRFTVYDYVSDSGVNSTYNASQLDGGTYTHHFKAPSEKDHYSFLYWKVEDETEIYNVGDSFFHDVAAQGPNTDVTVLGYAWWKADITLNLYDDKTLLGSDSKFDSISVSDILESEPTKTGYNFLGWVDENGNDVTETTFSAPEAATNPNPKTVNLYAKWEQIKIDIEVTKVWEDDDNAKGFRPDSITVELFADGEKVQEATLEGEESKWTHTFAGLVKFNGEKEIEYTINEIEVDNYVTTVKEFTITNKLDLISVNVTKVWSDDNNESGKRPDSITINLLANGEKYDEVVLSENTSWKHEFTDLPKILNGEEVEYTIEEVNVPEGYEVAYEGDVTDGFTIHNILGQGDGQPDESNNNNPQTGDNILLYLITLVLSIVGIINGKVYLKRFN